MVTSTREVRDYTVPEGCPTCQQDLPVRVSESGPWGVCRHCHTVVRPLLKVTARGLELQFKGAVA